MNEDKAEIMRHGFKALFDSMEECGITEPFAVSWQVSGDEKSYVTFVTTGWDKDHCGNPSKLAHEAV